MSTHISVQYFLLPLRRWMSLTRNYDSKNGVDKEVTKEESEEVLEIRIGEIRRIYLLFYCLLENEISCCKMKFFIQEY